MPVQVTNDTEFGSVVDLFVNLMEHERGLVTLGVRVSNGPYRLPPGGFGHVREHVPPESVRTVQDGNGLRSCCWRRVIPLESARLSLDSQPLRIPFASVVFDEVPCARMADEVASQIRRVFGGQANAACHHFGRPSARRARIRAPRTG